MTDEQIRIKIAETMGWVFKPDEFGWSFAKLDKKGPWAKYGQGEEPFPNYPADLNACAEFEAMLTSAERFTYLVELNKLCGDEPSAVWATARQRCLAYLKTKGLIP